MKKIVHLVLTAEELVLLGEIILAIGTDKKLDVKGLSFRKLALRIGEEIEKL